MLTGSPPFTSEESGRKQELEILQQHIDETPVAVHRKNIKVSAGLNTWVSRMLSKDRERRYRSTQEALKALNKCTSAVAPRRESLKQTQAFRIQKAPSKWPSRIRKAVIATILLSIPAYFLLTEHGQKTFTKWQSYYQKNREYTKLVDSFKQHQNQVTQQWNKCETIIKQLDTKFPTAQGYPPVNTRIRNIHSRIEKYLKRVSAIIKESEKQRDEWVVKYNNYPKKYQYVVVVVNRIYEKALKYQRYSQQTEKHS